jgi:hypothetical protein
VPFRSEIYWLDKAAQARAAAAEMDNPEAKAAMLEIALHFVQLSDVAHNLAVIAPDRIVPDDSPPVESPLNRDGTS